MEAQKAKAVAASAVLSFLILLIILWFSLGPSLAFFIVLGAGFALTLAVLAWVLSMYTSLSRRQLSLVRRSALDCEERRVEYSFLRKVAGLPIKFRLEALAAATDDFRSLLGRGSSASVFRGILDDGTSVAVKRLEAAGSGDREFRAEVAAIASVQHVNLVRLLGYCTPSSGGPRYLVYEFMANGSLDTWIFPSGDGGRRNRCLPWVLRRRVAVDVAKALCYLHRDCRARVLHLDVKPENILLDEDFRALLADFGLSKLMGRDESRVVTTVRGTRGYLAPEWLIGTGVTDKSDIYSYGMVLLEIMGGRRSVQMVAGKWSFFPRIVQERMAQGRAMEVLDERLKRDRELPPDEREVREMVHVALWCIQEKAEARPTMARVVDMLEGRAAVEAAPPQAEMILSSLLDCDDENDGTDGRRCPTAGELLDLGSQASVAHSIEASFLSGR